MTTVCQWIGYCFCRQDHPIKGKKKDLPLPAKKLKATNQVYDAVIVWKETPTKQTKGTAFEVILEPASTKAPLRPVSPPKERTLSAENIERKLKEAENRRQSLEAQKLERIARKEQIDAAQQKVVERNVEFSKHAERRHLQRMESMEENKNKQLNELQERLRDHGKRVEAVRATGEEYRTQLKERISEKMEKSQMARENNIKNILEKIAEHESHMKEVQEASSQMTKQTEQKMINKMESALKNREVMLQSLQDRLKEHGQRIEEVRRNKQNLSMTDS